MKIKLFILFIFSGILFSCKSTEKVVYNPTTWFNLSTVEDVEIYIDTANIRKNGPVAYAMEKRIFTTPESRDKYTGKIKEAYAILGKKDKASKWDDFSYCIYECLYECTNKRFRILSVKDYDSQDRLIAETTSRSNKNIRWLNIEPETVGDYTFFFVCDFDEE